jgi:hypothetical protein
LCDHTRAFACSSSNKPSAPHTLDWEDAFEADCLQQFSMARRERHYHAANVACISLSFGFIFLSWWNSVTDSSWLCIP